jgi:hypothetical protein
MRKTETTKRNAKKHRGVFIASILLSADETNPYIFSALYTFLNLQMLVPGSPGQQKNR